MRAPFLYGSILIAAAALLPTNLPPAVDSAEAGRIQTHIARAEAFAARRDLSRLTPAQRAARARELARLEAYRRRGEFPENRVRRERTPVFVDARGVHCAVGHLLALDGETALVARIAATKNCARIRELADEPELVAWLDRNGLTLEEAAHIQPQYGPYNDVVVSDGGGDGGYQDLVVTSSMLAATGVLANLDRGRTPASRSARVIYGSVVGAAAVGVGLVGFDGSHSENLGMLSAVTGLLSLMSTLHNHGTRPGDSGAAVSWTPRWQGSRVAFLSARF